MLDLIMDLTPMSVGILGSMQDEVRFILIRAFLILGLCADRQGFEVMQIFVEFLR